jgi:hypothetical protein
MGALIAYDWLLKSGGDLSKRNNRIQLVTLGSPLGMKDLQYRLVGFSDWSWKITVPNTITRWINHSDWRDAVPPFPADKANEMIEKNEKGVTVENVFVRNEFPNNPHKVYGYLRTPEFAHVVVEFLGIRFPQFPLQAQQPMQRSYPQQQHQFHSYSPAPIAAVQVPYSTEQYYRLNSAYRK